MIITSKTINKTEIIDFNSKKPSKKCEYFPEKSRSVTDFPSNFTSFDEIYIIWCLKGSVAISQVYYITQDRFPTKWAKKKENNGEILKKIKICYSKKMFFRVTQSGKFLKNRFFCIWGSEMVENAFFHQNKSHSATFWA